MRIASQVAMGVRSVADPFSLPSLDELTRYLRFHGWEPHPPGPAGVLWTKDRARVGVPLEPGDELIMSVVDRVARAEHRGAKLVADAARYLRYDVTHLRAGNDERIVDKIPLETAARIIASARTMLRATATTARWERAQIGSNYSKLGDDVIRDSFMGHTERGSFVIPVLIPIPVPQEDHHQPTLFEDQGESVALHYAAPEPFERRVVRTFAQSMQAVHDLVVEPARTPNVDNMYELVYRGVSREFCSALANVLDENAIGEFETRVEWAPVVPAPDTMPRQVTINAGAADLVRSVADRLRQQSATVRQIFSGTIVQFRHESPKDPFGEIAVSTIRRGRPSEVRVRLPLVSYREAWDWHNAGRAVLVEGEIRRLPGRTAIVDDAVRFQPLDELTLLNPSV